MAPVTPATLTLDVGGSQKRVRDVIRPLNGTFPDDATRWVLDDFQALEVRARLAAGSDEPEWALEIGDRVRRSSNHRQYRGRHQGGITTSTKTRDIFIFSDPARGARNGSARLLVAEGSGDWIHNQ